MLMRLTPSARSVRAFSSETVAGFISSVHSVRALKSSRARIPASRYSNCDVERALGVPPPKKMVCGWRGCRADS